MDPIFFFEVSLYETQAMASMIKRVIAPILFFFRVPRYENQRMALMITIFMDPTFFFLHSHDMKISPGHLSAVVLVYRHDIRYFQLMKMNQQGTIALPRTL